MPELLTSPRPVTTLGQPSSLHILPFRITLGRERPGPADVDNNWRISQEEIFGPVQVIAPFDDVDEAIALANDSRYGLAGMIWTTSLDTAHQVAREVRTGTMWVNCFFIRDLRAPFGGMKDSGIGREGGLHSEEFFTEAKAVVMQFPS